MNPSCAVMCQWLSKILPLSCKFFTVQCFRGPKMSCWVAVGVLISSLTSCKGSGCSPRTIIYNDESTVLLPTSYSFAMSLFPWFEVKICFISERHCKLQLYFVTFCISESFPIDSVRPFVMDIKCHWWQQFKVCKDSESNLKSQYIYWKLSVFVKKIKKHFKRLH